MKQHHADLWHVDLHIAPPTGARIETVSCFDAKQLRMFLRLLLVINPYKFLEEVAAHFTSDEDEQPSNEESVLAALEGTADEKLNGFALRIVLSDHVGIPRENEADLLTEAQAVFAPLKAETGKRKVAIAKKQSPLLKPFPRRRL